jgi:site-specific DNA-methyltransferase (adenine-specific)
VDVLSVNKLLLNNGVTIKLIGISEPAEESRIHAGKEFLQRKTREKLVFMRYDKETCDHEGSLLCYVYLENKTFLNAHIVKHGFANVDEEREYRLKSKFIALWQQYNAQLPILKSLL